MTVIVGATSFLSVVMARTRLNDVGLFFGPVGTSDAHMLDAERRVQFRGQGLSTRTRERWCSILSCIKRLMINYFVLHRCRFRSRFRLIYGRMLVVLSVSHVVQAALSEHVFRVVFLQDCGGCPGHADGGLPTASSQSGNDCEDLIAELREQLDLHNAATLARRMGDHCRSS